MSPADFFIAGLFVSLGVLASPFALVAAIIASIAGLVLAVWLIALIVTILKFAVKAVRGFHG